MRKLYPRLAATNLKKNHKVYIPYLLACTVTVMMFCILMTLAMDPVLRTISGGSEVQLILRFGCIVVGVFSAIILFYTNSVLVKQRKREFGLYNILGMEKRHIGRVLLWETVYAALIALVLGLFSAGLFSKLLQLLFLRLLGGAAGFALNISLPVIGVTAAVFAALFFVLYLNTLRVVHLSSPAELLRGTNEGEREPKSNWILALIGVVCLASGYIMSIKTSTAYDAIGLFFVAVLLVIAGTYLLFMSCSIVFLKALRRNKRYYYKTQHFATVSGMLYRMKRNAAGLASICILSTMVLVTVSTTVSLYLGVEDILDAHCPTDIVVKYNRAPEPDTLALTQERTRQAVAELGCAVQDETAYRSLAFMTVRDGDTLVVSGDTRYGYQSAGGTMLWLTDAAGYENLTGREAHIEPGCALYWTDGAPFGGTVTVLDRTFTLTQMDGKFPVDSNARIMGVDTLYLVVDSAETLQRIEQAQTAVYGDSASTLQYIHRFNVGGAAEQQLACADAVQEAVTIDNSDGSRTRLAEVDCRQSERTYARAFYGSFLFLGLFLGLVFALATVLIIYYKQISEGYDDRRRFAIMQQVGMTHDEVRATIRTQVLTVFFLPLVTAAVHVAFAFPMIRLMIEAFGLVNVRLFIWCTLGTIAVFAVVYTIVYSLTARAYYGIVNEA